MLCYVFWAFFYLFVPVSFSLVLGGQVGCLEGFGSHRHLAWTLPPRVPCKASELACASLVP